MTSPVSGSARRCRPAGRRPASSAVRSCRRSATFSQASARFGLPATAAAVRPTQGSLNVRSARGRGLVEVVQRRNAEHLGIRAAQHQVLERAPFELDRDVGRIVELRIVRIPHARREVQRLREGQFLQQRDEPFGVHRLHAVVTLRVAAAGLVRQLADIEQRRLRFGVEVRIEIRRAARRTRNRRPSAPAPRAAGKCRR